MEQAATEAHDSDGQLGERTFLQGLREWACGINEKTYHSGTSVDDKAHLEQRKIAAKSGIVIVGRL